MIILVILGSIAAWAVASRWLFRHWVRNDTFTKYADVCSHGYIRIDRGDPCHPVVPASHGEVAAFAVLAALFLPVTMFIAFVISNPPLGRRELEEKIRALEAENDRLQRNQDRRMR